MKLLIAILIMSSASFAFAKEDQKKCSNYAKYEAIRKYKSDTGTVQGSDGIQYNAVLVKTTATQYEYVVEISDNNEDGEFWTLAYTVNLEKNTCKRISISESETVSSSEEEL